MKHFQLLVFLESFQFLFWQEHLSLECSCAFGSSLWVGEGRVKFKPFIVCLTFHLLKSVPQQVCAASWDKAVKSLFMPKVQVYFAVAFWKGVTWKACGWGHMVHAGLCFCEWRQNSSSDCLSWGIASEISCLIHWQKEWLIHLLPCLAPGHCYSG